jgi:hypothetical protein
MRAGSVCSWRHAASCVLVSISIAAGCAGNGEGLDANGRPIGEDDGGGGGPGPAAQFTQIQDTIFTPICTGCHAGATAPRGLRLDAGNSFALLVGVASAEVPAVLRVAPGNPDASYLVQKIEGTAAVGARMPLGGPPLPQASIDLVRQWIAEGAMPPTGAVADPQQPMRVVSTIPADGESLERADTLVLIFSNPIDASLINTGVLELRASGGDSSFSEGNEASVKFGGISVSLSNPTVATLTLLQPLAPETYQLVIRGTGPTVLADVHGHALDGDGDGTAGADHRVTFTVTGVTP